MDMFTIRENCSRVWFRETEILQPTCEFTETHMQVSKLKVTPFFASV